MNIKYKDMEGYFSKLTDEKKEIAMRIVQNFHTRDGKFHKDGSMGSIDITNRQFNDCLAYFIIECDNGPHKKEVC